MRWEVVAGIFVSIVLVVSVFFFLFDSFGKDEFGEFDESFVERGNFSEGSVRVEEVLNVFDDVENFDIENTSVVRFVNFSINSSVESSIFSNSDRHLNLNENLKDVFGRYVDEDSFDIFFESGGDFDYRQKIEVGNGFMLEDFEDEDDEDEKVFGFMLDSGDVIFNYSIDFSKGILWEDFSGSEIFMFGRDYYVFDGSSDRIGFLEFPGFFDLYYDEDVVLEHPMIGLVNFSLDFLNKEKVILNVDGERVRSLNVGEFYVGEGFYIFVEDILYSGKGEGRVELVISPRRIIVEDGYIKPESEIIEDIEFFISPEDEDLIEEIKFSWVLDDEFFLGKDVELSVPFFDNLNFSISDVKSEDSGKSYVDVYLSVESLRMR